MKVIHVLNHFLPAQVAGTEVYVWALCKQLQQLNGEPSVLIPNYEELVSESYTYDGIFVYKYAEPSKPDRTLITGQKTAQGLPYFQAYLREQQPAIVHFHEISGSNGISVAHLEAAKALGFKIVFTAHLASITCNTGTLMYRQRVLCDGKIRVARCAFCSLQKRMHKSIYALPVVAATWPLYIGGINTLSFNHSLGTLLSYPFQIRNLRVRLEKVIQSCDAIVSLTHWYKEMLHKNGVPEAKISVVPQALPAMLQAMLPEKLQPGGPLRLVFVGRIDKLKGIDLLIEVIQAFPPNELLLDIYGASSDVAFEETCKQRSADAPHIRWKGILPQVAIVPTLATYHALVLPSVFSEMSPLVIQEAFAAGIPVVGSNVYGIAEQVTEGKTGFLFKMSDKASLRSCLLKLVRDRFLLHQTHLHIQPPSSFSTVAAEMKKIYASLLQ